MGIKARAKKFLREQGVKKVKTKRGELRIENAKTIDVLKEAIRLGF